eukprot:Colp12_sorted_trinity150504_noHs@10240
MALLRTHHLLEPWGQPTQPAAVPSMGPIQRTTQPTVTGTSVIGLKFKDGVILAADTLGSYGSLARYKKCSRLLKVSDNTVVAGSGDYADFQYIKTTLEDLIIEDQSLNDGHSLQPQEIHSYLTRVMYNRRSKMNPLWNELLVAGMSKGKPFLGFVDKLGVMYEDPTIATGYGAYIGLPLLRKAIEQNPDMNVDQARKVIEDCLRVLFYRDARSLNRHEFAIITKDGITITEPVELATNWDIGLMFTGYD